MSKTERFVIPLRIVSESSDGVTITPSITNTINYITISTLGNAQDFGDLTSAGYGLSGCSSSTRGVFGGGYSPTITNIIDYISIMSIGNAVDFGDLLSTTARQAALSNGHGGL